MDVDPGEEDAILLSARPQHCQDDTLARVSLMDLFEREATGTSDDEEDLDCVIPLISKIRANNDLFVPEQNRAHHCLLQLMTRSHGSLQQLFRKEHVSLGQLFRIHKHVCSMQTSYGYVEEMSLPCGVGGEAESNNEGCSSNNEGWSSSSKRHISESDESSFSFDVNMEARWEAAASVNEAGKEDSGSGESSFGAESTNRASSSSSSTIARDEDPSSKIARESRKGFFIGRLCCCQCSETRKRHS